MGRRSGRLRVSATPPSGESDLPRPRDEQTRSRMRKQRRVDTAPELALRRELHRRGLRYRVDYRVVTGLRRRADVAFTRARVAIFVDGCFWHACPQHGTRPKHNQSWWDAKLKANVQRDRDTDSRLEEAGWQVLRVWEHEDMRAAANRVQRLVADDG